MRASATSATAASPVTGQGSSSCGHSRRAGTQMPHRRTRLRALRSAGLGSVLDPHVVAHRLVDGLPASCARWPAAVRPSDGPVRPHSRPSLRWLSSRANGSVRRRSPPERRSRARRHGRNRVKRHSAANASTSANASASPSSASHMPTERMPGLSISSAPKWVTSSSRTVVVCRPRWSPSRTVAGRLALPAKERVDDRRLADAGRSDAAPPSCPVRAAA